MQLTSPQTQYKINKTPYESQPQNAFCLRVLKCLLAAANYSSETYMTKVLFLKVLESVHLTGLYSGQSQRLFIFKASLASLVHRTSFPDTKTLFKNSSLHLLPLKIKLNELK